MRIVIAGATGVIGRQLVPLVIAAGHEPVALARSEESAALAAGLGAKSLVADLLDREAVRAAVAAAAADSVVHLATAIPSPVDPRRMAAQFATTNRLRTEGTANLLDAAADAGVRRAVTQSIAFAYDPAGTGPATEDDPLWRRPPRQFAPVLDAIRELERRTTRAGGTVLRFGHLYGPGTQFAADGSFLPRVRAGQVPLVGGGTATFSFTHAYDAAASVLAAVTAAPAGTVNVVDDEPAPVHVWLPVLAGLLGAPAPKRASAALARLAVGGWGVAYLTRLRGASNARAKRALGWAPRYPSWRDGFAAELAG